MATWIQAVGVLGTIWVALYFYHRKEVRRRKEIGRRRNVIYTQLKTILEKFRFELNEMETAPFKKKKIWLPNEVLRSRDFHLLGGVGINFELLALADQLCSLNGSIGALPTKQPIDPEKRSQAEAEIKEGLNNCRQVLGSIFDHMKGIEAAWSDKKPSVVRRLIDATQRLRRHKIIGAADFKPSATG